MSKVEVTKAPYQIEKVPYEIWNIIFKQVSCKDLWLQQTSSKCWHKYSREEFKKRIINSNESHTLCRIYGKFLVSLQNEQWITCMYFNTTELEEVPDYDNAYFKFKKPSENSVGLWVPRTYGFIPWSERHEPKEWLFYDVSRTPYLYIDFPDPKGLDNVSEKNYDGYMDNLPSIILKDKKGIYREKFENTNATLEYQIEPLELNCGRNMDGLEIKLVKFKILGLSFHASHLFH